MIAFINGLLDFFIHYPVVPPFFFVFCFICAIPVIMLLIATQKCALHQNCRYLITFWCISLLLILANTCQLQFKMFFYDKGFVPRGLLEPVLRPQFLVIHSLAYASSSCFEMYIAFERILSTFRPQDYHVSRTNWAVLVVLTIFAYSFGAYIGFLIYLDDHHIIGFIFYNIIDLSTLMVNEAYEMARAMHPVYFGSFLFKSFGMALGYFYVLLLEYIDGPAYALMDMLYFAVHAINCAYASGFLIRNHRSLRKAALKIMPWKRSQQAPIVPLGSGTSDTTNQYFNMLDHSWK